MTERNINAYIINLKRRVDRLETFNAEVLSLIPNVKINVVEAIDGRMLDLTDEKLILSVHEWNFKYLQNKTLRGVIACCQSHMKCLEQIILSDSPYAIVFEDDCTVYDNMKNCVNDILTMMKIPEKFSVVYLNRVMRNMENINDVDNRIIMLPKGLSATAEAYLISKEFAQILLTELKKDSGVGAFDAHLKQIIKNYYDQYQCYQTNFPLFKQKHHGIDSDIQIVRSDFTKNNSINKQHTNV
jgi:GR25 family glycosyltransferase involved in LPS biosynthesis